MIVNIYDVGHGFCGYVRDGVNGSNLLIDCGYNENTLVHPVDEVLGFGPIGGLLIQNYDEDHIDGLPHLIEKAGITPVGALYGNPLTNAALAAIKDPPYSKALRALAYLRGEVYTSPILPAAGGGGELSMSRYWNSYPLFTDTNSLSVVTFVHGPNYSIVFTGDMTKKGWQMLLWNPAFRAELAKVKVFVASHHGRIDGYCERVFDYCKPDIVVISDSMIEHETQGKDLYAKHAGGIWDFSANETRYVVTTRCDGTIRIGPRLGYRYFITRAA